MGCIKRDVPAVGRDLPDIKNRLPYGALGG
jgi:hypothetical protein